jgi:hypothetical protein
LHHPIKSKPETDNGIGHYYFIAGVSDTISQHSRPQTTPLIVNSISNFQKSDITRKRIYRPIDFTYLLI